ncbi:thermonuclease family protein [Paucibacter sp. B2R-40]|uniref:thermonuclease family protein n=1 Tax=Paucibacter sp. B2R-40 TaxID=2893554 RepID=UPI0021E3A782|nr:thermonuclease family protein [Paucibacter sp. B2R-40]MCV2355359.1 thermonuclease family protein [Paucibacter sp. B2R-40]
MATLAALLALTLALGCQAETIVGKVVGVADGDTVTVLDGDRIQHKIRLSGIDAPEKKQPFGQKSKESLSGLIFGKAVSVDTTKKDRYGREIGKVLVDGKDANLEQLNRGMAWHYKAYAKEQPLTDRQQYAATEQSARDAKRGLWHDLEPIPPWEFRHNKAKH